MNTNLDILKQSAEYEEFVTGNPDYDIVSRTLMKSEQEQIRVDYPEYGLFPYTSKNVMVITLISRVIGVNGYPKLKAYIDGEKEKIMHIFVVK